jgi:hypothetical protein
MHMHTCRHAHAHAQPAHTHHSLRGPKRALPKRLGACPAELTPHPQCRSHACMGSQPASQRGRAHLTGWTGMNHSGTELWRIPGAAACEAAGNSARVACGASRVVRCVSPRRTRRGGVRGGSRSAGSLLSPARSDRGRTSTARCRRRCGRPDGHAAARLSGADRRISRADCSIFRGTRPHDVGRSRRRCG